MHEPQTKINSLKFELGKPLIVYVFKSNNMWCYGYVWKRILFLTTNLHLLSLGSQEWVTSVIHITAKSSNKMSQHRSAITREYNHASCILMTFYLEFFLGRRQRRLRKLQAGSGSEKCVMKIFGEEKHNVQDSWIITKKKILQNHYRTTKAVGLHLNSVP